MGNRLPTGTCKRSGNKPTTENETQLPDEEIDAADLVTRRGPESETTQLHYAAFNGDCDEIKRSLATENIDGKDADGRTPLMLAALNKQNKACMLLLREGAQVTVTDKHGESCFIFMLDAKMTNVASLALDRLHEKDSLEGKQTYDLKILEKGETNAETPYTRSPLQAVVDNTLLEVIDHPVFRKSIEIKWQKFARWAAKKDLLWNLLFVVLWSMLAVVKPHARGCYEFPLDLLRVLLWVMAILCTIWFIVQEYREYKESRKKRKNLTELLKCIRKSAEKYEEKVECKRNSWEGRPSNFYGYWNYYDWFVYFLLTVVVLTHLIDIGIASNELCHPRSNDTTQYEDDADHWENESLAGKIHLGWFAFTIIFVWFRLYKSIRAFTHLGPFILVVYIVLGDVGKFLILALMFYLPFSK
ncbi:uncharacterized protein LOC144356591 [Saccoglossus kowalevskii]